MINVYFFLSHYHCLYISYPTEWKIKLTSVKYLIEMGMQEKRISQRKKDYPMNSIPLSQ